MEVSEKYEVIEGEVTKHNNSIHLSWDCPIDDMYKWAQGEFSTDADGLVEHYVFSEDDEVLYIVKGGQ